MPGRRTRLYYESVTAQFVLTQHNQYAIVLVVVIALSDKPLQLVDMHRHMEVSGVYLHYMLKHLCAAGVLKKDARMRARYQLGREASEIRLKEITSAVDSSLYAKRSKARKTLSGEFRELLFWNKFCLAKLGESSVADVIKAGIVPYSEGSRD